VKAVSNSSVLISLSLIGRLELLRDKFGKIYIPKAIWKEVVVDGEGEPGSEEVRKANWIEVVEATNKNIIGALNEMVDAGESETIALALQ